METRIMGIKFTVPKDNTYNIFDLDAYVCLTCFAAGEEETENDVLRAIDIMIDRSREMVPAVHELGYLTAGNKSNFRYQVAKTPVIVKCTKDGYFGGDRLYKKGDTRVYQGYKATRANLEKPKYFNRAREYVIDSYGGVVVQGIEADDQLGIEATVPGRNSTIHTHDKDLNMVRVDIFNLRTRKLHVYDGDLLEKVKGKVYGRGLPWFYCQMLTGDSGDNIPGIPGYGPVGAYKVLQDCATEYDMFHAVLNVYSEYCKVEHETKARLLEIAQLLWMHTTQNNDIKSYLEQHYEFN